MCEDVCDLSVVNGMRGESIVVSNDLYEGPCGAILPKKLCKYDSCFPVLKAVNEDAGGLLDELCGKPCFGLPAPSELRKFVCGLRALYMFHECERGFSVVNKLYEDEGGLINELCEYVCGLLVVNLLSECGCCFLIMNELCECALRLVYVLCGGRGSGFPVENETYDDVVGLLSELCEYLCGLLVLNDFCEYVSLGLLVLKESSQCVCRGLPVVNEL